MIQAFLDYPRVRNEPSRRIEINFNDRGPTRAVERPFPSGHVGLNRNVFDLRTPLEKAASKVDHQRVGTVNRSTSTADFKSASLRRTERSRMWREKVKNRTD